MKKFFTLLTAIIAVFSLNAQSVTVSVGAGYANDVYYSIENGTVASVDRSNWDIGFKTNAFSASIIANHASGVEVYTYSKGDTAAWSTLDTSGMNWSQMYNSIESWDEGAFAQNDLGHPDYGWGIYNMGNHHIIGDSLFVIKTVSGQYKKLWFVQKNAVGNEWTFKYANLDGTGGQTIILDAGLYDTKNFVYYSIDSNLVQDREPASEDWDMLFTKYFDYTIPYSVTGVLTNEEHAKVEEVNQSGMNQATFNTYTEANFGSEINIIGSDWKSFNMSTMSYDVADTTVFFLKTYNANDDSIYHKLYFTAFGGSSTGDYTFMQELLLHTDVNNTIENNHFDVYPNPATHQVTITIETADKSQINLLDVQGKIVLSQVIEETGHLHIPVSLEGLKQGVYFIQVVSAERTYMQKLVKQ